MAKQKYHYGDVIHLDADPGPGRSHSRKDEDAVVLGSYNDQYRGGEDDGRDQHQYTLLFFDGGQSSWYPEEQMTFLRHGTDEIVEIKRKKREKDAVKSDLNWIVSNWKKIRDRVPGASMETLMKRIGITNPWGSHGEGMTYFANMEYTFNLLDKALSTENIEAVEGFLFVLENARKDKVLIYKEDK